MSENKITPAKGRPILHWFCGRPLDYIKEFPARLIEVFLPAEVSAQAGDPLRKLSLLGEAEAISYGNLKDN